MSYVIRHAKRSDVSAILGLIRELADYEHELDAVQATEETLLSTIAFASNSETYTISVEGGVDAQALAPCTESLSPSRPARCLLLFPSSSLSSPVGMALYFYNYSTWRARPGIYLEDLFVQPTARGKGYGKALLKTLAREVVSVLRGGRLEWSVLKWNEPSIGFYEKTIGATMMSDWVGMRLEGEALERLAE